MGLADTNSHTPSKAQGPPVEQRELHAMSRNKLRWKEYKHTHTRVVFAFNAHTSARVKVYVIGQDFFTILQVNYTSVNKTNIYIHI